MPHLISFLGAFDYYEVEYDLPQKIRSSYFSVALATNLKPDRISIFVTEQSEKTHYKKLLAEMKKNGIDANSVRPVPVPNGSTLEEIWQIFDKVIEIAEPGEEMAFDITYGFRFLPVIVFLSVIYLRAVKGIVLNDLYYAAFQRGLEIVSVWRLSEFIDILDWLEGVNAFIDYGDAGPFGRKLREIQGQVRRENKGEPFELQRMGDKLHEIAEGLRFCRPRLVTRAVDEFQHLYGQNGKRRKMLDKELESWVKPLTLLREEIISGFTSLCGEAPETYINMAGWFIKNGYYLRALTLMREAVVSWCILKIDGNLLKEYDKERRREAENALSNFEVCFPQELLSKSWKGLRDLRNDAAHSGFRDNPCSPQSFEEQTKKILHAVREIIAEKIYGELFTKLKNPEFTVLITPLGVSPGTLFSFLSHCPAHQAVALTSKEGAAGIEEAKKAAGYNGKISVVLVDDPFRCFDAGPVVERCRTAITTPPPYRLLANVTGGTTALQLAVQAFYRQHRGPKIMVAVVDTRPFNEQKENPFEQGELVVVEEE